MKRLKIWHIGIMLAAALTIISSCEKDDAKYELEFEVTVPEDWQYWIFNEENVRYYAWSPLRTEDDQAGLQDTISEDLQIIREYFPGVDLDFYFGALNSYLDGQTGYMPISTVDTTINGVVSKKHIHLQTIRLPSSTNVNDSFNLVIKPIKFVFYRNEYGYIISCGALPYTFDYYKPIHEEIVSSFNFID